MDDWFVSLISIFFSSYNFAIAIIAINNGEYIETVVSAFFSILCFSTGYVLWKRNREEDENQKHRHRKIIKAK